MPRVQKLEYGDPDSYNGNVLPSAVCSCRNHGCRKNTDTFGNEGFRHYFGPPVHDSLLLQEAKLFFDRSTSEQPKLVETEGVVTLREDGGFLTSVRKTYKQYVFEGDVPLLPKDFVPGVGKLIRNLLARTTADPDDRAEIAIGVPASFGLHGIKRIRECAKNGLRGEGSENYEGISLYYEPLAAARSYMAIQQGTTLVLDYGGGTLDITVMRVGKGAAFDRANVSFDGFGEGGSRMDEALLNYCLSKQGQSLADWYQKQRLNTKLRIKRNIELAKMALSKQAETALDFPGAGIDPIRLTPGDLAFALQPIMARMVAKITEVIMGSVAGKLENIDFVVLSGGSSLTRAVQNSVLAMFKHIPEERFVLPDPNKPADVEICLCAVGRGLALLHRDGSQPIGVSDAGVVGK